MPVKARIEFIASLDPTDDKEYIEAQLAKVYDGAKVTVEDNGQQIVVTVPTHALKLVMPVLNEWLGGLI